MDERKKLPLKTHRLIAGYTVKQAANVIGVSEKSIRDWEKTSTGLRNAKFIYITMLCELYGISTDELQY